VVVFVGYWLVIKQFAVRSELWPQNYICFTMILSIVVHVALVLRHHCRSQLYTMLLCNTLPMPSCSHADNVIIKNLLNKKKIVDTHLISLHACKLCICSFVSHACIYPKLHIVYSSVIAYTLINGWINIHLHYVYHIGTGEYLQMFSLLVELD